MKIITITDIHGHETFIESVFNMEPSADLVLISGDITQFGGENDARRIVENIRKYTSKILAVSGNCDYPATDSYLDREGIGLHGQVRHMNGIQFAGLSGSLPCPGQTPNEFTESLYARLLEQIASQISTELPLILVTHHPPYNTLNDRVLDGRHVGCRSIRKFIDKYKPQVCVTGHIHEGCGIDTAGPTSIINSGPLFEGKYGLIRIERNIESIEIKTFG